MIAVSLDVGGRLVALDHVSIDGYSFGTEISGNVPFEELPSLLNWEGEVHIDIGDGKVYITKGGAEGFKGLKNGQARFEVWGSKNPFATAMSREEYVERG